MKKRHLTGAFGVLAPLLLIGACSGSNGVADDDDADDNGGSGAAPVTGGSGGTAGTGTSGTSGTSSVGGVTSGGATGASGSAGSVGNGGTLGMGGTGAPLGGIGPGGSPNGGAGGFAGSGVVGGQGGTAGSGAMAGSGGTTGQAGKGGAGGKGGSGGASGKGGSGGVGGKGGSGGAGGKGGSGGGGSSGTCATWPTANGAQSLSATMQVSGTYDGTLKRFTGSGPLGSGGQEEGQSPLFELANGATLRNVIIGAPAADGIHCSGGCTLENVWWEDVGEDAATFRGSSSSQTMTVRCGGARNASDKVFQHNGAGTLTIQNFTVETFGKLYRSCGNCDTQYARHVVLQDISARSGDTLVGINTNYGDTADFDRITVYGNQTICERYTGNNTGAEPVRTGTGPDSQYCRYTTADITQR